MTDAELLPPAVLKRKAVVYVRQSTPAQVQTHLAKDVNMSWLMRLAAVDFATSKSSMMTSVARRAASLPGPDSRNSLLGCAPARSAPFCALTPRGSPGTVAIGITFLSFAGWSRRGSSISTGSTTRVAPTIVCCSG